MCINIYMSNEFFEDDEINAAAGRFFRIGYVYPYQRLVIHNVLCGCGHFGEEAQQDVVRRQIVILPTGSGKSLCFMLPGALIERPVLMIFPLLSLMSDQERRIREAGQSCAVLRGGQSKSEREEIYAALKDGRLRFLIANPETLLVPSVANAVAVGRYVSRRLFGAAYNSQRSAFRYADCVYGDGVFGYLKSNEAADFCR